MNDDQTAPLRVQHLGHNVCNQERILKGLGSYLFYQYHCLLVNQVYAEINTFLQPFSKRLFIAMIHRKVFNIKMVNIHFKWRKFLRNIRE